MIIEKNDHTLEIRFPNQATIHRVEEDLNFLKETMANHKNLEQVTLDVSEIEEIDTYYFQLICTVIYSFRRKGIALLKKNSSPALDQMARLYQIDSI